MDERLIHAAACCMQFVPGAVDGPISPNGWCIAYAKKS